MKLVEVDRVPMRKRQSALAVIDAFALMDVDNAEVIIDEGEYKNLKSAQATMCNAIRISGYAYKASIVRGHLYLFKIK